MLLMQQQILNNSGYPVNAFVFSVEVSLSLGYSFTIPTQGGYTYNYDIITSDGQIFTGVTGNQTITFPSVDGIYEIIITGTFPKIFFNNAGSRLLITSIDQWGDVGWGSNQDSAFFGCNNLTSIPTDDVWVFNTATTMSSIFREASITALPDGITLAGFTGGYALFMNCNLTSLPSSMVLNHITAMGNWFYGNNLTSLPSGMYLTNLSIASYTFYGNNLTSLPSGMTLASLINGSAMFMNCNLTSLPSGMVLGSVTNASSMFRGNSITSVSSGMTLASLTGTGGQFMFFGNTISTSSYSQLINNIDSNNANTGVTFHGGSSKYNSSASAAHTNLTSTKSWTITDAGLE